MKEEYAELSKAQAKQVCRNLGKLAAKHSITNEAVAERTGYRPQTISRMFQGRFIPELDYLFCLLAVVNELSDHQYSLKDVDTMPDELHG